MSYFHGRGPTIIGAKAFHVPVRDGKEWFHFAMVVRQSLLAASPASCQGWLPLSDRSRRVYRKFQEESMVSDDDVTESRTSLRAESCRVNLWRPSSMLDLAKL